MISLCLAWNDWPFIILLYIYGIILQEDYLYEIHIFVTISTIIGFIFAITAFVQYYELVCFGRYNLHQSLFLCLLPCIFPVKVSLSLKSKSFSVKSEITVIHNISFIFTLQALLFATCNVIMLFKFVKMQVWGSVKIMHLYMCL